MKLTRFLFISALSLLSMSTITHAKIISQAVSYEHNGVKLEGVLAYDDSLTTNTKLPGVIIFPEWWGINDYVKDRAKKIASLGYIAFVADMYGAGVSTKSAKQAGALSAHF